MAGITTTGFDRETFQNIEDALEIAFINSFGAGVNTSPETVTGQFKAIFSTVIDDLWHLFEAMHNNKNILNLEGAAIDNFAAGITDITRLADETDAAFLRRITMLNTGGTLYGKVLNSLTNIAGVTRATILYNDGNVTDSRGIPSRSWTPVVIGGSDSDIADALINKYPGGVGLFGNTTVNATDIDGFCRGIRFTRPVEIPIQIEITITYVNTECASCKTLDTTGVFDAMGSNACNYDQASEIINFDFGANITPALIASLMSPNTGVSILNVELQNTNSDGVIPIKWYEYATLTLASINIIQV